MPPLRRILPLALVCLPCGGAPAVAGVAEFLAACAADGADLARLPARLAASGWTERDPEGGPAGPAIAAGAALRRLWTLPGWNGGRGDAFTGLSLASPGRPVEVCWHVSRPGESGAAALTALRHRFPPVGPVERGTESFYGGRERWPARIGSGVVFVEVGWPLLARPGEGFAMLSLSRVLAEG